MVGYRRQNDSRRGLRFTLLVTGAQGTGKTSFVNSLLDQNIIPHRYQRGSKGTSIPKTITFSNLSRINASEMEQAFDAANADLEPGIAIAETSVEIIDEDDSKILLTVIDTPGFGDNLDNSICIKEICSFLEQQFDFVLAEETKVRRNPRFEDTRVHACLYFIEPTGHGLRELDVETMQRISKYVNVIPIIGRADSFTKSELANFKRNILQDIEKFKIPVFQFQSDESETDPELIEESRYLSQLQPFAIVTSDTESLVGDKKTRVRTYPWGTIDINDTEVSDFPILKSVLLGSQLQELKDITHDFLYEAYRTEKLSSVADLRNDFTDSVNSGLNPDEPPSMSNLAEIAKSQSMAKFDLPKRQLDAMTNKFANSSIREDDEAMESASYNSNSGLTADVHVSGDGDSDRQEGKHTHAIRPEDTQHSGDSTDIPDGNTTKSTDVENLDSNISNTSYSTVVKPSLHKTVSSSTSHNSPQLSVHSNNGSFIGHFQVPQSQIDPKKLRKISETVPYMLRHETLRSKQAKLEELERQSALELSKRAMELERKAKELKQREAMLRERLAREHAKEGASTSSVDATEPATGEQAPSQPEALSLATNDSTFLDTTEEQTE